MWCIVQCVVGLKPKFEVLSDPFWKVGRALGSVFIVLYCARRHVFQDDNHEIHAWLNIPTWGVHAFWEPLMQMVIGTIAVLGVFHLITLHQEEIGKTAGNVVFFVILVFAALLFLRKFGVTSVELTKDMNVDYIY